MEGKDPTNEAVEQVKTFATEAANSAVETKTAELKTEMKASSDAVKENQESIQKQLDEIKNTQKTNSTTFGINKKRTEFEDMFAKAADEYKNTKSTQMELSTKTFTPTASASTLVPSSYNQESAIKYNPNYKMQIRDAVSTIVDNENGSIIWNRQTNDEATNRASGMREGDGNAAKTFGSAAAQTTIEMQRQESTFRTLTGFYTMPEEYFNDINRFESFISTRLMGNLMDLESRQLISGSGTGNNYNGLLTFGTQINSDALLGSWANSVGGANRFDAITALASILAQEDYTADTVILNPFDYYQLTLIKATTAEYVLQQAVGPQGLVTIWNGLKFVKSNAVAANTFIVYDSQAFEYVMRESASLEFDRNGTDFQANNISVRAQLRGNIADWLPLGVKHGTFTGTTGIVTLLDV